MFGLLKVLTGGRFEIIDKEITKKGEYTMETIIDRYEARGFKNGETHGENKRLTLIIRKKVAKKKPFETIVEECESTPEEVRPIYEQILREQQA